MTKEFSQTRTAPRVPFRHRVYCTGQGKFFSDLAANISEGGIGLETISRLEPGDDLEIEFTLPNHEGGLTVRCTVVWVRPVSDDGHKYGTGLQFSDLTESERTRIRNYVRNRIAPDGSKANATS